MTRALSLTCLALILVGLAGSVAFAGKPSIAVLGLEVVDQNGTPTAADTQAAKDLTEGLRARAKAGTGPYQLAPGSDKELIDQKLLNNCDGEAASCMSSIGNQLGAAILMYGRLEKQGKSYQVTLKVLDVGRKAVIKSSSDMIPLSEANGPSLQAWAKKMYSRLTGDTSGGTVLVKLGNAERGTILIDGEPKGTITNGSGQVSGLADGKYRVGVESEGFRRWEKDVTLSGGSITVPVELESGSGTDFVGSGFGPGGSGGGTGPEGRRGTTLWKGASIAAVLVSASGVAVALYGNSQRFDARDKLCKSGAYHPQSDSEPAADASCPKPSMVAEADRLTGDEVESLNSQGERGKWMGRIGAGVAIASGGFAVYAIYKGFVQKQPASSERNARGRRVPRERFVVTPIVSPDGGGATLRIDW